MSQVGRYNDRRQSGLVDLGVVVGVDAYLLPPQMKGKAAVLHRLEFVVGLEVGEAPQPAVDDVGKALLLRYLTS